MSAPNLSRKIFRSRRFGASLPVSSACFVPKETARRAAGGRRYFAQGRHHIGFAGGE
jgi:hypothetical protein